MKFIFFVYLLIPTFSSVMGKSEYKCSLPRGTGLCLKLNHTFAYNPVTKKCIKFAYGGCGGIGDHFDSIQACESACKGK